MPLFAPMGRTFGIGLGLGLLLLTVAPGCREGSTYVDHDRNGGVGGYDADPGGYGPAQAPPPDGPTSSIALGRGDLLWLRTAGSPDSETVSTSCAGDGVVAVGRFDGTLTFEADRENETTIGTTGAGPSLFVAKYERDGWLAWARELGHGPMRGVLCQQLGQSIIVVGSFGGEVTFELPTGHETLTAHTDSDLFVARLDGHGQVEDVRVLVEGEANVRGMHCTVAPACVIAGDFRGKARLWPEQSPRDHVLVSRGERDVFVAPIVAPVGHSAWPAHFGGVGDERASAIAAWGDSPGPWPDDGHFVVGSFSGPVLSEAATDGHQVLTPVGGTDAFVLHIEPDGQTWWAGAMGGPDHDAAVAVVATPTHVVVGGQFGRGADEPSYLELEDGFIVDSEGRMDAFVATYQFDKLGRGTTLESAYGIGSPGDDILTSMVPRVAGASMTHVEGVIVTGQFGGGGPLWFRSEQVDARCSEGAGAFVASLDDRDSASPAWTRHYCGARVQGVVAGVGPLHIFGDFARGAVFGVGEPYETRLIGAGERDAFIAQLLP